MEFAGRTIPEDAEQIASELYARLARVDEASVYPDDAEEFEAIISGLASENFDAAVALFILSFESNSMDIRRKLAPKLAMYCRNVDPEIGNRLLHTMLTSGEPRMRYVAFLEIESCYSEGKLSYEEYMPFYTTFELETAKEARYRIS
jgi:hypothetical protein